MRHFVSLAAKRTFCPSLPIARLSWSSGTETLASLVSRLTSTSVTLAGDKLEAINFF